jgi:hypothetical protein
MKRRKSEADEQRQSHAIATAKVRIWGSRADKARLAGRTTDASRCDDKVRDWASKARQIERTQKADR